MEYESISSIKRNEPRIQHIQSLINLVLSIVDLEYEGEKVEIDGFRLKNLDDWVVDDFFGSSSMISHLARKCDSDCKFCYHKGYPKNFSIGAKSSFISKLEMDTRMHFYKPKEGKSLFVSSYEQKEVLYDPKTLGYLNELREKSDELIMINTNGLGLTEEVIKELKKLEPLIVIYSVNSIDQNERDELMQNSVVKSGMHILEMLKENEISYVASVAMWPTMEISSIMNAIDVVSDYEPYFIRLIMPGYTDHFKEKPTEDFEKHFSKCVDGIMDLRKKIEVPLVIYPEAYVADRYQLYNSAYLIGVVKGSPAYFAGLKSGDIITAINGINIDIRSAAKTILNFMSQYEEELVIDYLREGNKKITTLKPSKSTYPYSDFLVNAPFGIMMSGSLEKNYIKQIDNLIKQNNAVNILFMTSELMKSQSAELFQLCNYPLISETRKITLCTPKSIYLGGNMIVGDMLTHIDYVAEINQHLDLGEKIDLVIIPSSTYYGSNQWKRDMSGMYYKEIEWETGIKTELLECSCFLF